MNWPAAERDPISCVRASGFPFLVMLGWPVVELVLAGFGRVNNRVL